MIGYETTPPESFRIIETTLDEDVGTCIVNYTRCLVNGAIWQWDATRGLWGTSNTLENIPGWRLASLVRKARDRGKYIVFTLPDRELHPL